MAVPDRASTAFSPEVDEPCPATAQVGAGDLGDVARSALAGAMATCAASRLLRAKSSVVYEDARRAQAQSEELLYGCSRGGLRAPATLGAHVLRDGSHDVVLLQGELDIASRGQVASLLGSLNAPTVTVDLSGLCFIDASALEVLLAAQRSGSASGRTVLLRGGRGLVRRVFSVLELDGLLVDEETGSGAGSGSSA